MDLGAGTGSVGLEALRLQPQLQLMAVERRRRRPAVQANARRLGVQPAAVIEGDALPFWNNAIPTGCCWAAAAVNAKRCCRR